MGSAPAEDFSVEKIIRILRKRRMTIVLTLGVCIALAVLAAFLVTTRYECVATVEVNQAASDMLNPSSNLSGMMSGNGLVTTSICRATPTSFRATL